MDTDNKILNILDDLIDGLQALNNRLDGIQKQLTVAKCRECGLEFVPAGRNPITCYECECAAEYEDGNKVPF